MRNLTAKQREWQQHIEAWSDSGLSQVDYCRQNNIKPQQFYSWRNQLKKKLSESKPAKDERKFLPIHLSDARPSTADSLEIKVNNVSLYLSHNTDPALFKKAIKLLGGDP